MSRRDDGTAKDLIDAIGLSGRTVITDYWEGFHRLIPEDQLFTGKDLLTRLPKATAIRGIIWRDSEGDPRSRLEALKW